MGSEEEVNTMEENIQISPEHAKYGRWSWIECIDAYKEPEGEWSPCPRCNLTPRVWVFNNGNCTACGCWNSMYRHWSIHSESIGSVLNRTGGFVEYDGDDLRKKWNHYCETGEILFNRPTGGRADGRW